MSTGAVIAVILLNVPWVLFVVVRGLRGFRNPDTAAGDTRGVLTRRYIDDQFAKPRDESDLL
jgi:hypothetical protein